MPLIPELPENLAAMTFDPENGPEVDTDVVDLGEDAGDKGTLLLENQAKIAGSPKLLMRLIHHK